MSFNLKAIKFTCRPNIGRSNEGKILLCAVRLCVGRSGGLVADNRAKLSNNVLTIELCCFAALKCDWEAARRHEDAAVAVN